MGIAHCINAGAMRVNNIDAGEAHPCAVEPTYAPRTTTRDGFTEEGDLMITAMISGKITAAPEKRVGSSGRAYVLTRVQVARDGDTPQLYVGVFGFDTQVQAVLMALGHGAEVAISGSLKLGVWTDRHGQARCDGQQRNTQQHDRAQRSLSEAKAQWAGDNKG